MTAEQFLAHNMRLLSKAGVSTARLDVLVLMEDVLGLDRASILAHPEMELAPEHIRVLNEQIERRAQHVPLAYIRGKTEFYGRTFAINENVLEPRPESETLIDLLRTLPVQNDTAPVIVDVGTGSGALAITAKLELAQAQVIAIDIDPHCCQLATQNAQALKADITVMQGDLLQPIAGQLSASSQVDHSPHSPQQPLILLCNLPYVPESFHINQAATHEPRLAIFGGPDGLDVYRKLFAHIDTLGLKPEYILAEALPPQHAELTTLARSHGYKIAQSEDFIVVFAL